MGKLNPKRYKPFVRSSSPFCGVHCAQWIGAHVDVHCVAALWREYGLSGLCEVKWHCDICTNHESTQPWLPPLDCWASVCQVGLPLSLSLSTRQSAAHTPLSRQPQRDTRWERAPAWPVDTAQAAQTQTQSQQTTNNLEIMPRISGAPSPHQGSIDFSVNCIRPVREPP